MPIPPEIVSQSTPADRETLDSLRKVLPDGAYRYLEIGSYLGASLFPHLVDPHCELAVSIDRRPDEQYDERNKFYSYEGVTTARMVELLQRHAGAQALQKLRTHDGRAGDLDLKPYAGTIDLAFIDGEHTISAVFDDFLAVRPAMKTSALVVFHDALIVFQGLMNIESLLRHFGQAFESVFLPDSVYAIALGEYADRVRSRWASVGQARVDVELASRQHLIRETVRNYAVGQIKDVLRLKRSRTSRDR